MRFTRSRGFAESSWVAYPSRRWHSARRPGLVAAHSRSEQGNGSAPNPGRRPIWVVVFGLCSLVLLSGPVRSD